MDWRKSKVIDPIAYRQGMERLCSLYNDLDSYQETDPKIIKERIFEAVLLIEDGVRINKDSYPYHAKMKDNINWVFRI